MRVSDASLEALAGADLSLESLTLERCDSITDEGIASIVRMPTLKCLNIALCTRISDRGIYALSSLPCLEYIDLSFCSGITQYSLLAMKEHVIVRWDIRDAAGRVKHAIWKRSDAFQMLQRANLLSGQNTALQEIIVHQMAGTGRPPRAPVLRPQIRLFSMNPLPLLGLEPPPLAVSSHFLSFSPTVYETPANPYFFRE